MDGTVATGEGEGSTFVEMVTGELTDALGFRPYPGTLNLRGVDGLDGLESRTLPGLGDDFCDGTELRPCTVGGVRAAVIRPFVPDYPPGKTEVLAPVRLRTLFDLSEGDEVRLGPPDVTMGEWQRSATGGALDEFEAVVFDLDGTLVDLAVDWPTVHREVESLLGDELERPFEEYGRQGLFRASRDAGVYADLDSLVSTHESEGAAASTARPLLDVLPQLDCPVGICTANAVEAANVALEQFGVHEAVDVVVGRDSLREQKPNPTPLTRTLQGLGVQPGQAVFVGDEDSDATTAARAGTSFVDPARLQVDSTEDSEASGA